MKLYNEYKNSNFKLKISSLTPIESKIIKYMRKIKNIMRLIDP